MQAICRAARTARTSHAYSPPRNRIFFTAMSKGFYNQSHAEKRLKKSKKLAFGTEDDVLLKDVQSLLSKHPESESLQDGEPSSNQLPERFSEIEVDITSISSTGDGIGLGNDLRHVFVVPFTTPGDRVVAKVVQHFPQAHYSSTDFVKVLKAGSQRRDDLVKCRYFAKCAGCQLQMLSYDEQLLHKRHIVEKAFRNFSGLTPEVIPPVQNTIGSPMQYGYRTKLTPHFDGPPGSTSARARKDPSARKVLTEVPAIGYQAKGRRITLDIEDCPIGTDVVQKGLQTERTRIAQTFSKFTKGATLLLRESTSRLSKDDLAASDGKEHTGTAKASPDDALDLARITSKTDTDKPYIEEKTCITDQKATSTEYIDDFVFKNTAGAFFQNNNSILSTFTAYIRNHIISKPSTGTLESIDKPDANPIKYLIDAYCGSGLFTVTLSSLFKSSVGIDIAGASIIAARENAIANKIENTTFMTADASKLFAEVKFPPDETAVVIDPPRKGCDEAFLQQLLAFGPKR